jgi:hypothetical protein
MRFDDYKLEKSTCEKYTIRFNDGWDWAIFTIDNTGIFNCQSSFGNFNYHWTAFGNDFKKFLCGLDSGYLFTKLCDRISFDYDEWLEKVRGVIIKDRHSYHLDEDEARQVWNYIIDDIGYEDNYTVLCMRLWESRTIGKIYSDIAYSDLWPEQDYSRNQKVFVLEVYPKFVEILENELKC